MKKPTLTHHFVFKITIAFVLLTGLLPGAMAQTNFFITYVNLKEKKTEIVQSAVYDAQALYNALRGYNAFAKYTHTDTAKSQSTLTPLKDSVGTVKPAGINPGPNIPAKPQRNNRGPMADVFHDDEILARNGPTPLVQFTTGTKHYQIIESTTGNILRDDVTENELENVIKTINPFPADGVERERFITGLFARNLGLPAGTDSGTVHKAVAGNLYLNPIFTSGYRNEVIPNRGTPIAGLDVTNLALGFTNFLVEHVNEELDEAFFIRLQEVLSKYPELQILFPNTLASLNKIQVTNYTKSGNALKAAFQTDVHNILGNISELATLKKYQDLINKYPAITLLFVTCDMIDMLQKAKSPADILYALGNAPYVQLTVPNHYNGTIKLASVISNAFVDVNISDPTPTSLKWVPTQQLTFLQDPTTFKAFMGLMVSKTQGIKIAGKDIYASLTAPAVVTNIARTQAILNNFVQTYKLTSSTIKKINNAPNVAAKAFRFRAGFVLPPMLTKQLSETMLQLIHYSGSWMV